MDDDIEELGKIDVEDIETSNELVARLSEIFDKGLKYVEGYAILLATLEHNPDIGNERVLRHALRVAPELEREIKEASASLLT